MTTDRDIQRSILPIPDRARVRVTTYDAKDPNTRFAPIEPIRPPKGAPNVLVVLLDDVGGETGSRVTDDYPARNGYFNGKIHWVQLDVGKDNFSHLIKPEDRLRVVMTRQ